LLQNLVNAARLAPSASNLQPLEFVIVDEEETKSKLFPCLKWATYITPAGNPKPGQEPAAYIVTLLNSKVREKGHEYDVGAAVENMALAAWSEGVGSCWMISIDKPKIAEILGVPENFKVDNVLSLGYPAEEPRVEEMKDSPRYWKDGAGRLHVPKRNLEKILHWNRF
jgi:nitroreductase